MGLVEEDAVLVRENSAVSQMLVTVHWPVHPSLQEPEQEWALKHWVGSKVEVCSVLVLLVVVQFIVSLDVPTPVDPRVQFDVPRRILRQLKFDVVLGRVLVRSTLRVG